MQHVYIKKSETAPFLIMPPLAMFPNNMLHPFNNEQDKILVLSETYQAEGPDFPGENSA